jgi:hypothetical protein
VLCGQFLHHEIPAERSIEELAVQLMQELNLER